jgi:hypothetical protein
VNRVFTLSSAIPPGSEFLFYRNGVLLTYNVDYTIAGTTLTFLADPPCPTDGLLFYGSLGYTIIPATVSVSGDTTSYTEIDYLHFVNTIVSNPELGVARVTPKTSVLSVIKLIDETRNNNTTITNDSELIFPLEAGGNYAFQFYIMMTTTINADFKFTINYNGSGTVRYFPIWKPPGSTTMLSLSATSITTFGNVIGPNSTAGQSFIEIKGSVNCTTAGTFGFGWAQLTSDAGPTTVFANSYGLMFKVN